MSSHKHHEHLNRIKEAVKTSEHMNEDEKTNTIKHIDEWLAEDKAEGMFVEELLNVASSIRPILAEMGLL